MGFLHLVRHGQASAGTHNYDRLSETGERQSQILGQWWSSHGFNPDAAFHGSLVRQRDTAQHALDKINLTALARQADSLNEYNHRVIESHFASESDNYAPEAMNFDNYLDIMTRWRNHSPSGHDNDLELWQDFHARGLSALHEFSLPDTDKQSVFFTSGGVIATVLSSVLNLDFEHTIDAIWRIRNTSITTFHHSSRGIRLVEFNAIPHLLEHRDPSLITLI